MYAIQTTALSKRYGSKTAIEPLSLTIRTGELFALLGVNGAGKTTLIKMLSCLTQPTHGDAIVGGYSVKREPQQVKRRIGVSPQENAVAPKLSVRENLELITGIHSLSKHKTEERISVLADRFSLHDRLDEMAERRSGGCQRRVSLAMALISEPQILFLDEPTLGLDVLSRHALWKTIESLKGRVTVVLTTHYLEEAEALSDRIGILKKGRLLGVESADAWKEQTGKADFESAFIALSGEETV